MGNVGGEINKILGNIATVIKTVDFATKILGGPGSGGLFGVDTPTGVNQTSPLRQYTNQPGNLGVTNQDVYRTAATLPSSGSDMLNRIAQYEPAWNTIRNAANTASTSVTSLINFCTVQQQVALSTLSTGNPIDLTNLKNFMSTSTAQISAAQTALIVEIAPILARAATASSIVVAARAMLAKVQAGLNSNVDGAGGAYLANTQALGAMPPSLADVANAQQTALKTNVQTATANPPGSLTVSGSILIDRMTLISTNATALKGSVCTAPAPTPVTAPAS